MIDELEYIVGNIIGLNSIKELEPTIYYKDGKPYGFIKFSNYRNGVLVISATKDDSPFLREMIIIIRKIAQICPVYILHNKDRKDISDNIVRVFGKKFKAKQLITDRFILTIGRYINGSSGSVNS